MQAMLAVSIQNGVLGEAVVVSHKPKPLFTPRGHFHVKI